MYLRKIIAHRGFSYEYPENTMLAFQKAIELGVKCIETDVTILKDGTLVLFHDYETKYHTDFDGVINDLDYDAIQRIDAGSWKNEKFKNIRIPTLQELIDLCKKTNTVINLELKGEISKNEKDSIVENTVKTVADKKAEDLVFYSSFEFDMLRTLKKISKHSKFGILLWEETNHWKDIADELKPQSMHLYDKTINKELAKNIKNEGYELYIYTVNSIELANELYSMGVDGVFTDMPNIFDKKLY
ncbi:glycerophosphodiester phosphodiesterase family protein [Brachyspira pilosicoli]|uniref:glycerophosphodiester phosphodiesterase n=1 Tax=Brachyspira pilosicoli TaxID=52584 RepID=UPI003007DB7D